MKTPSKERVAAGPRWQLFVMMVVALTMLWVFNPGVIVVSPRQMVSEQVVRGEKIAPVPVLSSNPAPAVGVGITNKPALPSADLGSNAVVAAHGEPPAAAAKTEHFAPVSFKQLSGFQFRITDDLANPLADVADADQQVCDQIPTTVLKLNGKDIALTGFMLPVSLNDGLVTDFMLLPNQMSCCYGVKPRINEWVIVHTAGKGIKSVMDTPVTALGMLHVGAQRENGSLTGIYQIDLDQLKTSAN